MQKYGADMMQNLWDLPVLHDDVFSHYEGSIDKIGANADWDWFLYQQSNGEWVIFDVCGAGCIYNFVQHRYISSEDAVFRFYFDGEETPRFEISNSEFGAKYPFVPPLASAYIGPVENGRGPIRVVRSFVPMPYKHSCKITSSVKLSGYDRSLGQGGWGHVMYHRLPSSQEIQTFNPNSDITALLKMWKNIGSDPKFSKSFQIQKHSQIPVQAGQSITIFASDTAGTISSVGLILADFSRDMLENVWIRACWDDGTDDVYSPIGGFFGNTLGYNPVQYLMSGITGDGYLYNYFPMPYWKKAHIELINKSERDITVDYSAIQYTENTYRVEDCGYFRSSEYYSRKHTPGSDSIIGQLCGRGKLVCVHVTCFGERQGLITCEGDVRVHIDGSKTPRIESDGSESYVCYGWGFATPPETHPSGGYDGLNDNPWSMTRQLTGDWYSFRNGLRFGIESGENNNQYLEHSGILFYYGQDKPSMELTDRLDLSCAESIAIHGYTVSDGSVSKRLTSYFEGDDDHLEITFTVSSISRYSSFRVNIRGNNNGVILRRYSDQYEGRQAAKVFVDGCEVSGGIWSYADSNTYKRWLDDEFYIPPAYTNGRDTLEITIKPIEGHPWNECEYQIYTMKGGFIK